MTQRMFLDTGRCSDLLNSTSFLSQHAGDVLFTHTLLAAAYHARLDSTANCGPAPFRPGAWAQQRVYRCVGRSICSNR